jgi:crossover junction endodeoxyribonuclease RuvC
MTIGPSFLAVDMSLTSSGWAHSDGTSGVIVPPSHASRGIDRVRWIRGQVLERSAGAAIVALEGYSFMSKGNAVVSLGELGGAVRCALRDAGIVYVDIPPSCRAMFATGKGNAGKPEVLAAAIRRLNYEGHDHNVADVLWLLRMATMRYTSDDLLSALTPKQQQALASVAWPVLEVRR